MTLDYYTTLNYICLFLDFFVVLVFIYGSIVIKDIPYEIAKKSEIIPTRMPFMLPDGSAC